MAAAFRSVNTHFAGDRDSKAADTMTTPPRSPTLRPNTAPEAQQQQQLRQSEHHHHGGSHNSNSNDDAKTPTRVSFGNVMASQKPLPSSSRFPDAVAIPEYADDRHSSAANEPSRQRKRSRDSEDIEMGDSDGDTPGPDDGASDDDSVNGDGSKSGKKKKSQRFYCTDYPPCSLSFTRSEHLARHIRKHTGERPFQCHCSRRFSRLDNLRQHAQTVHVNEDIPMDSLAATGARFQRQIRTERARQPGGRSRASTSGSLGAPGRGHSKSLSTSSIGSVSSIGSGYVAREDLRPRPPPLVMADPRPRGSMESYRGPDGHIYRPASPGDFSTPTSATFSTGQGSPRWGSALASPTTSHSRSHSLFSVTGARTPGRRLSVPSGANPFQSPQAYHQPPGSRGSYGPSGHMATSSSGPFSPATSSIIGSPTSPASGWAGRRESTSSAADEAWRRRTWHPDSRVLNNPAHASSHLSSVVTQNQYQTLPTLPPANASNPPSQGIRLPPIESFDSAPIRPGTPPRRQASPMAVDAGQPPHLQSQPGSNAPPGDPSRGNTSQWDMGLHRGLTRLDIRSNNVTPPRDGASAWATEAHQAVQTQAEQARAPPPQPMQPTVRFDLHEPQTAQASQPPAAPYSRGYHQHTVSAPSFASTRDTKRRGWYHGPIIHQQPPAGETGQTPQQHAPPRVDRMEHPNMSGFRGFPARETIREDQYVPPQQQLPPPPPGSSRQTGGANPPPENGSSRFDALVAVAASEGTTAAAY